MKLVELFAVQDVFASGIGRIDILGTNARLVFYVERINEDGTRDNVVVECIVMPIISAREVRDLPVH